MITQSVNHISSNHIEISTFNEGILYKVETIDIHTCKLNGPYKLYYDNGKLQIEENYVNGLRHGSCKQYRPNGQLWVETNCLNGKLHGSWKQYLSSGNLYYETNYINGIKQHDNSINQAHIR